MSSPIAPTRKVRPSPFTPVNPHRLRSPYPKPGRPALVGQYLEEYRASLGLPTTIDKWISLSMAADSVRAPVDVDLGDIFTQDVAECIIWSTKREVRLVAFEHPLLASSLIQRITTDNSFHRVPSKNPFKTPICTPSS